ncbi:hypothetical protein L9F63_003593, partial [Diploptera punctata]
ILEDVGLDRLSPASSRVVLRMPDAVFGEMSGNFKQQDHEPTLTGSLYSTSAKVPS